MARFASILACAATALCLAATHAPGIELYGCDDTSLYTVNPVTGVTVLIGALNPPVPGLLGGLEMADGTLYGLAGTPGNTLWRVDPATATASSIGSGLGVGLIFEGGLAFDGQDLWGVNQGVSNAPKSLIKINRDTGTATVQGMLGPDGNHDFNGLAFHDGQLYGIDRLTNALWNINRTDPTLSHMVGIPFGGGVYLGVKGGMADEYCYADGSYQMFRVDFATGAAQVLSVPSVFFRSLAPTGLTVNAPGDGARLRIESVDPNPASDAVRIRCAVAAPGIVRLAVHDAAGRLVRILAELGPGGHTLAWDGRDTAGKTVPAGIYFLNLVDGPGGAARKVIIVR